MAFVLGRGRIHSHIVLFVAFSHLYLQDHTFNLFCLFAIHRNLLGLNAVYRYAVFQDTTFSYLEKMIEVVVL